MATSQALSGCCVSRYVTLAKGDTLKSVVSSGVFANNSAVAWCAVTPEDHKVFLDAFEEASIPYHKLGNGQLFFYGSGQQFTDACNMEYLRPLLAWEKKEGRKRNEKRVGDIIDVSIYVGRGYEGRVEKVLGNGNVTFSLTKTGDAYYHPVGKRYENYGSGFTKDYFQLILSFNKDGSIKDNDK